MVRLFLFLSIWLCVCGCSDERLSHPIEMVFFDGVGEVDVPATTIGGVPPEVQVLLWGDRDALMQQLLDLGDGDDLVATKLIKRIYLIDKQRGHYTKYLDAGGIAILGDQYVYDNVLYATQEAILAMTSKRPDLRDFLTPHHGFRMILYMDHRHVLSVPERHARLWFGSVTRGWCGGGECVSGLTIGGTGVADDSGVQDFYVDLSTFTHELGHAIHSVIRQLDPTFQSRLEAAYARAMESGSVWWEGAYAYENASEYWAEGVQFWFYAAANPESHLHPHTTNLQRSVASVSPPVGDDTSFMQVLLDTDPLLYALLDEWLPLVDLHPIERKWGDRFWE